MNKTVKKLLGDKDYLGRRYICFLVGVLFVSFGVAFTAKAGLGNSPVSCIPYSLSLIFPRLSFGGWLFAFCIFQVLVQIILLCKNCVIPELVIQVILGLLSGYLTDAAMLVLSGVVLEHYVIRLLFFLAGCVILAIGVYLELLGSVAMLSGDAFIKAIADVSGQPYGKIKVITDVSMSVIAFVLCMVCLKYPAGVREGTIIAAVLVGTLINLFKKLFKKPTAYIIPSEE